MIHLSPMCNQTFEQFKKTSQSSYATNFAMTEEIPYDDALTNASEQFDKLVPNGTSTQHQLFYDVVLTATNQSVGFLWLGLQTRFGRKIASINDIQISPESRGRGLGKVLMKLVEDEAKKHGATRVRLHVFQHNEVAQRLYLSMGFRVTNLDMRKDL